MNNLDNPFSGMINLMREQGAKFNAPNLLVGEVINADPVKIKVGDVILDKDNLYIADYLLRDYKRAYKIEGELYFNSDGGTINGSTKNTSCTTTHNHLMDRLDLKTNKDNFYAKGDGNEQSKDNKYFYYKNLGLEVDDLVAIQQLSNSYKFIVFCKIKYLKEVE